jgi:hypothetical protein
MEQMMARTYLRTAAGLPLTFELDDSFLVRFFLGDDELDALPEPQRLRTPTNGFTHIIKRWEDQPIGLTAENVAIIDRARSEAARAYLNA